MNPIPPAFGTASVQSTLPDVLHRFNHVFNSLHEVVCAIDLYGRYVYVSEAARTLWGYAPEEMAGRPFADFVVRRDRKKSVNAAARMMRGEELTYFENRYLHKEGHQVPVAWSGCWDVRDKLLYCAARDISEQQQMERSRAAFAQELERRQQEQHSLLNSVRDGYFAINRRHQFTQWNTQAERMLQCSSADVLGRNIWRCFPEARHTPFLSHYQQALSTRAPRFYEIFYAPLDTWFEISSYPTDAGLSVFFRDINEHKQLQAEVERLRAELDKRR